MLSIIKNITQIIRLPNLLILAYTLYLVRYFLFPYVVVSENYNFALSDNIFALLVLSTILIAAAGYIINDFYDEQADAINKPKKIQLNQLLPEKTITLIYYAVNIIALLIAFYVANKINAYRLVSIHLICIILLWLYSAQYKHKLLIGNIMISLLCALSIFTVWIFEFYAIKQSAQLVDIHLHKLNIALWGFILFSFILTLMREIIKDIEDIPGDTEAESHTLPIIAGIKMSKIIVSIMAMVCIFVLIYAQFQYKDIFSKWLHPYIIAAIELPLLFFLYIMHPKYNQAQQFHFWSRWLKIVMFTGISAIWFF